MYSPDVPIHFTGISLTYKAYIELSIPYKSTYSFIFRETDAYDEKELSDTKTESCDKFETVIKTDESKNVSSGDEEITVDASDATTGGKQGSLGEDDPGDTSAGGDEGSMGTVDAVDGTTAGKQESMGDISEMKYDARKDTDSDMVEKKLTDLATSDIESEKPEKVEMPVPKRDDVENDEKQCVEEHTQDNVVEADANPATQLAVENDPSKRTWTVKRLKAIWIKFNLDLSPKVNFVLW